MMTKVDLVKHIVQLIILITLSAIGMIYPFLPGDFDSLAIPISTMIQVFGVVGLLLVPIGILWIILPKHRFGVAISALVISTMVVLIIALFATLSVGKAFGILTLLLWTCIVVVYVKRIRQIKRHPSEKYAFVSLYLICLPITTLALQLMLARPLTERSRDRAIENAATFIAHIEAYHNAHGTYPLTLQAQNKDYRTDVVGVEKYLYAPQHEGYNLSFEQPRFLLDRFGTREWVVYNPLDENRSYSHTAWLLTELTGPSQGWYASGPTGHPHWKYFFFD